MVWDLELFSENFFTRTFFCTKRSRDVRDVTFQGQGHVISRSLLLIFVAYVRMHLCAKFDANRTIRLRVIQMTPNVTDRQTDKVTDSHTQVITIPTKVFSKTFAVKTEQQHWNKTEIYAMHV